MHSLPKGYLSVAESIVLQSDIWKLIKTTQYQAEQENKASLQISSL